MNNVITEKIGTGIELMMEGLPQAAITPKIQADAALAIVKHCIPMGADIGAGILGGVRYATIKIGSQFYKFKYAIRVMRVMVAAEVYSEAIGWIDYKKSTGALDSGIADMTKDYLYEDFQHILRKG